MFVYNSTDCVPGGVDEDAEEDAVPEQDVVNQSESRSTKIANYLIIYTNMWPIVN